MTQAQECAHRFATTREQRLREETNEAQWLSDETDEALADFEEQLRDSIGTPGMYEFLDRVAARLEALGVQ